MPLIYKICHLSEWRLAESEEIHAVSAKDHKDRFIHFSTAGQVAGTLERYYAGAVDLVLVAVEEAALGPALRYEPSTGGELFPHLYGALPHRAVKWVKPIGRGPGGRFVLPKECV